MISKIFNKSISVLLTFIFIFGLIPSIGFAQPTSQPPGEIKGFNKSVFESHFSRADRETNPEKWLSEAKFGITQSIYAWELIACALYDDPLLFEEAKNKIEKWSNEELEARFSQWLTGRFFGEAVKRAIADLSAMFGETQKNYSWHLDGEGNIVFDDKTGDPLIIRPGDDGREFSHDLLMWQGEAEEYLKTYSISFDTVMARLYTELLAYIPEKLRETMSIVIMETGANVSGSVKREFENIAAREKRIFTSRRTRDILSLRRQSDDEAARIFTQRLITEIEETCARGIEELTVKIEEAAAGTGDLAILGEEWLRLYKEQFDRGLKAWEEAEERFFIRRIEWEQESFKLFSEGEGTWLAAFNQFEEERRKWELKAKELFQSGEMMFKNISEEFEKNIAEARQEFELNMAMRIGEGTTKVKALVDMYLICSSAAISAMENVQFWHSQYIGSDKKDPKDPDFYSWLKQEQGKTKNSSLKEIINSYELYLSYTKNALDARERILANYAELFGTGALKDILSPGASSEDFCLDEYQIALVRAKALVLYWERKSAIAEAVIAYANEFSAGRITNVEGIRAWEDAKTAYNESLAAYERELEKLNTLGEDIQRQQKILHNLSQEMLQAEEILNKLNSDYSTLVTASLIDRKDFYLLDLNTKYELLVENYKLFQQTGDNAVYKTILEYGMKWDLTERREAAENILDMLINGDGEEILSLEKLKKNVIEGKDSEINLKIRLAAIDLFAGSFDGQLRTSDSSYSGADWYVNAKGLNLTEEEKSVLYGEKLNAQLVADYKNSSIILTEKRLELELNSLKNILSDNPTIGGFEYIPPEFCLIDAETAADVYEILLSLKQRMDLGENIYTSNDEKDAIIYSFLSGGSFFEGSEQYLTEYLNDYYFCYNLLNIYGEYAVISSFGHAEFWRDTCDSLTALFAGYGLVQTNAFLPSIQSICELIYKKPGDFLQNAAQFLLDFESCFLIIPQWLEYEISIWKDSIIKYIAAYAFNLDMRRQNFSESLSLKQAEIEAKYEELYNYANSQIFMDENEIEKIDDAYAKINNDIILLFYTEQIITALETLYNDMTAAGNEKHWREYLAEDNDYITNNDPAVAAASTWKEGVLADALFNAVYYTNRINDSFAILSQKNHDYSNESAAYFFDLYSGEISKITRDFSLLKVLYNEIAKTGRTYELSKTPQEEMETQLRISYEALKAQEDVYNALRDEYFMKAGNFLATGSMYDEQYSVLKKAHDNSDQKRFEYEKQDAIQRWASTAYLGTDHIDLKNINTNLSKAQTVLTVISDIYSGENRRPYENPEYNALYAEYKQSFRRKIKTLEAIEAVLSATIQETSKNEKIFSEYQNALNQLGYVNQEYKNYISPQSRDAWSLKDIITVKDGRLAFSRDSNMTLTGINAGKAKTLDNLFNTKLQPDDERFEISAFEKSLRELSQRMAGYFADSNKFKQWSLARDYLITSLINANGDLSFLADYYSGIGEMKSGGSLGSLQVKGGALQGKNSLSSVLRNNPIYTEAETMFYNAWLELSKEEKADLEFYIILTLSGYGNNYMAGFSQMYTLDVYENAYKYVKDKNSHAKKELKSWWKSVGIGLLIPGAGTVRTLTYMNMRDVNQLALGRINPVLSETQVKVEKWITGLRKNISSTQNYASAYIESCKKLEALEGKKTNGASVTWYDINRALLLTEELSDADIAELKIYWEKMQAESGGKFADIPSALDGLLEWARNTEDRNKAALETRWLNDAQAQQTNEKKYLAAVDAFFAGTVDAKTLKTAAENAYGKNAAAWKNHHDNVYAVLLNDISMYPNAKFDFYSEFSILRDEITVLTAKTLENRYRAELAAREIEWNLTMRDIAEKYNEWLDSAAQIIENGRTDWIAAAEKMENAYKQWRINFQNEYNRVSGEWAEAYLAGLEDKGKWLEQAASAVNQASAESFLLLVGTEGERLSRFMDTREPFGIRNAVPEAETLMAELLKSSGIANMYNAFGSINNISNTASTLVKRGMGGVTVWDAALARTAAVDLSKKTNAEIADMESRKLAYNIRLVIDEAIKNLTASVDSANQNFRNSMDDMFIFNGLWRKTGNSYSKDIVKGSTLFTPVISTSVFVDGYKNYKMEPVSLQTKLDESYLERLDTMAIRGLLEDVYIEIGTIAEEIFGISEDVKIIENSYGGKREQSPGKFGAHIGYEPIVKPGNEIDIVNDSIFYDSGAGELGRLMCSYIYWSIIDAKGMAELNIPAWDKRIWNDEGSSFKSPSVRSTFQVVSAIAAIVVSAVLTYGASIPATIGIMALSVGISTSDDLFLGTLDVASGYKTFGEAGFEFGKTLLTETASSVVSGLFSGIGGVGSALGNGLTKTAMSNANTTIGKVMVQTAMTGAQTLTTGLVTSAINGITYSRYGGLGYSGEMFKAGMKGTLTNTLSSMTNIFTSGTLQAINSGFSSEKLTGFNNSNKADIGKLNNLFGSLAGQGVNYALGDDFTLNILNFGLFTGGKFNSGLLELHLGRDGTTMNIGTDGANISPENLAAALRGAQVWNVNSNIGRYVKNNYFDSAIALRAQYGFGDSTQRGQLWDILNGRTGIWINTGGDLSAETTIVDGRRMINLSGYLQRMSEEEQMRLAVLLGHEAYRDGIVTGDNNLETRIATLKHTEMALRMILDGQQLAFDDNLIRDIIAYSQGMDFFNAYVDNYYDSSADYWKLVYDNERNAFLEYDGLADIYDQYGVFLVGTGINDNLIESLIKYLDSDSVSIGLQLTHSGFVKENGSWITDKNIGNRIAIGKYDSENVTDYIYAAHRIPGIQVKITSLLNGNKNISTIRNSLLSEAVNSLVYEGASVRDFLLTLSLVNFYLPSATMFGGIASDLTTKANGYPGHKGIDFVPNTGRGTIFNTVFSGKVIGIGDPIITYFNTREEYLASQGTKEADEKRYYSHHEDRTDENGNKLYLYDTKPTGNSVTIEHGFMLNGNFLSMGFYTRSNHFDSIPENITIRKYLSAGTGIGAMGNTGWSTRPHVDYNLFYLPNTVNAISFMYKLTVSKAGEKDGFTNRINQYMNPENIYNRYK